MTGISQRLDLRNAQQLVMTPQLQQAIKLLQLNNQELSAFLEEELVRNPLLEKAETEHEEPAAPNPDEPKDEVQAEFDEAWTGNEAPRASSDPPDFDPGTATVGPGGNSRFDPIEESFEDRVSTTKTLRDHVTEQLHVRFDAPMDRMIGAVLIDHLDESGYMRTDPHDLALQLGCSLERIDSVLHSLKEFDPTGVFARDLAECLSLQLREKQTLDAPMETLLSHLDLLARHEHKKLCDVCGVNETYLKDMIAEIRALNPKPASAFDHTVAQTAIPDVLMKRLPKSAGGGWRVELNSDTLPRVLVNQQYYTDVLRHATQKKDKEYLNTQMQAASWLVRALDQRAQTILKTASALVETQDAFFNYGIEFLKPMTLKDIAEMIAMHESTVSRVTAGKYIGTPRGIFELKFFFTTGLESADGTLHSAESVRARIRALIEAETPGSILSDDTIVDLLKAEGIDIARRTVAKYRESMGIASSVLRRRIKKTKS